MEIKYVERKEFRAIDKAAHSGGWLERAVTVLDKDLNVTKCIHHDGGYIVIDDAYDLTVLHIDENGFVREIKEVE